MLKFRTSRKSLQRESALVVAKVCEQKSVVANIDGEWDRIEFALGGTG
jgi:hypothetical protein